MECAKNLTNQGKFLKSQRTKFILFNWRIKTGFFFAILKSFRRTRKLYKNREKIKNNRGQNYIELKD